MNVCDYWQQWSFYSLGKTFNLKSNWNISRIDKTLKYKTCNVTSQMLGSVISQVAVRLPPDRCPAHRVWSTASWRPLARWTWCRLTAAPGSLLTYSLSAFWHQMQILFCGAKHNDVFYDYFWERFCYNYNLKKKVFFKKYYFKNS